MKLALGIAATIAGVAPAKAAPRTHCETRSCEERVAMHHCSQTRPLPCLRRAALHWRVSERMLVRKARCESGLNPYAYFGHPFNRAPLAWSIIVRFDLSSGLLEFKPPTWLSTPYGRHSIWSAKWQGLAGAWMHHVGRGGEWACR